MSIHNIQYINNFVRIIIKEMNIILKLDDYEDNVGSKYNTIIQTVK